MFNEKDNEISLKWTSDKSFSTWDFENMIFTQQIQIFSETKSKVDKHCAD